MDGKIKYGQAMLDAVETSPKLYKHKLHYSIPTK